MATRLKMKAKRTTKSEDKGSEKSGEESDAALLSKPLTTSINNLVKIINLYHNTSEEIRQYLTNECDILYECRVCRSIFRSLSNLILHKRKYCQDKFSRVTCPKWFCNDDDYLDIIQKETHSTSESNKCETEESKVPKKKLDSIIDSLTQKKKIDLEIENMFSNEQKENEVSSTKCNKTLDLEYVEGSNCVFQTLNTQEVPTNKEETMKLELMEMYSLTEGQTAILGPDGKVTNQKPVTGLKILNSNENTTLTCPKCNINFSTRKTLLSHIKYKHESERVVYPCLECSETFSTVWSVFRHLYNIHHKTLAEVRKMRSRIKAKSIKNDISSNRKDDQGNCNLNDQQKIDEENQAWMDNFETDNDIQMCGGCGRRFERKAALNSHSQTCQKRITARNIINVNKQKRVAAQDDKSSEKKNPAKVIKLDTESEKKILDKPKGNVARKRKIGIQIRYDYNKPNDKNIPSPAPSCNISEDNEIKKKSPTISVKTNNVSSDKKPVESNSEKSINTDVETNKSNLSLENDLIESEVVSIPSSNSSPNKEEQDPLSTKNVQNDSDCEIEEILDTMENSIFDNHSSSMFEETKDGGESDYEDVHDQYKVACINESTLKLIKLINSDIPEENLKPTLDDKMANYINFKKLKCIPCDAKFGNISKLRHHMAYHFNWNRFRCDVCTFKSYDKIDVFEHIKRDHSILEFEKIEAVILQIPDWETIELSSNTFIPRKDAEITSISKIVIDTPEKKREQKDNENSSGSSSPDNCILIESNDSEEKQSKKQSNAPKARKKIKVFKEHITGDSASPKEFRNCSQSENTKPDSKSASRSNADPALKKMVYEVIFGDVTLTKSAVASSVSTEDKDSVHVVPNDVSNVISRPVRNRVKPLLYKDFIYDLHGFKEHQKTVLESNNNRKTSPLANKISESLEDLHSSKKTNKIRLKKSPKKSNKPSFDSMDNIDKNLNLQKRAIQNFGDNQILGDENIITIVDPKAIINENNTTQSDEEDDDIYIIENEELVAVK